MARSNKRKRASAIAPDPVIPYTPSETPDSEVAPGTVVFDMSPFQVEWVNSAKPPAKKVKKQKDVSQVKEEEGIPGSELGGLYTVSPGEYWENLRKYRNFVVNPNNEPKDDAKHKFEVGQFVFVNHSETPSAVVESDKESWVAQVREVRAEGQHAVYIRVLWFYWPDELASGREPYHGERELVASNYHQIIDAMTVSGKANVHQLKDVHDMSAIPADDLFWRQTLDTRKKPLRPSSLPKECICKTVTSPDVGVVRCPHDECGKWQHENCLVDSISTRHWEERSSKHQGKKSPGNGVERAGNEEEEIGDTIETSPRRGIIGLGRQIIETLTRSSRGSGSQKNMPKPNSRRKKARRDSKPATVAYSEQPWAGKITAKLQYNRSAAGGSDFSGKATIYRVSQSQGQKVLEDIDDMEAHCLFCKQSFVETEEANEREAEIGEMGDLDPSLFVSQNFVVGVPNDQEVLTKEDSTKSKARPVKNPKYDAVRDAVQEAAAAAAACTSNGERDATSSSK